MPSCWRVKELAPFSSYRNSLVQGIWISLHLDLVLARAGETSSHENTEGVSHSRIAAGISHLPRVAALEVSFPTSSSHRGVDK